MTPSLVTGSAGASAEAADHAWAELLRAAAAPYRQVGRFAWHTARGKLGHDPAFRGLLQGGHLPPQAHVLDLGCGAALLASLLQACSDQQARGAWPAAWPDKSSARSYTGIDRLSASMDRARVALRPLPLAPHLVMDDLRHAALPACNVAVLLDVLHYLKPAEQEALLQRVKQALLNGTGPHRRLLLRVADGSQRQRFWLTQWIDRAVIAFDGHADSTCGRPLNEWQALLSGLGFTVRAVPMSQGTLFANVLLVCDLGPSS